MNVRRTALAAAFVAALGIPLAWAAGNWSTLPVVGGGSFCASTVTGTGGLGGITGQGQGTTGSICGQTVPAGPPLITGSELIPADTGLAGGAPPQTVVIPESMIGGPRINRIIGGDFNTNLWQRGTTPVSAATPSTTVIGADRWAVYSSTNTVTVIKETAAADTVPAAGLLASMRVSRPSSATVTQICTGQVLDKQAAAPLIGNNAVFSTYLLAGAGFATANPNSNVTMTIAYYTAADSATPLTNTDSFMKGTTTGYTAAVGGTSNGTTGTVASGIATVPISTTWTRYSVWAPIPVTTAAGTAITGLGVTICYTPTVGSGGTTEWFEVAGAQLESQAGAVTASLPNGVTSPRGFERRPQAYENALQLNYSYVITDGAITRVFGFCQEKVANTSANCYVQFPQELRGVPTTVVSATGWSIQQTDATNETCSALAGIASSNTILNAGLLCTAGGTITLGTFSPFLGGASAGPSLITFSAEP